MRRASALVLLFTCGCFGSVFHLERNAPGKAPIEAAPPASLGTGQRIRPEDPGERMVSFAPEVAFGGGYFGDWSLVSSAFVSGWYGERTWSHVSDEIFSGDTRVPPEWSIGGAVGYDLVALGQADRRLTSSLRISSEGAGLELGHAIEIDRQRHSGILGFYLASFSRFFWLRLLWGPDLGFGTEAGIAIDYAFTWVWSR